MKISLCLTTYNEEESIGKLLDSLVHQTKKPNEIIIVDGGSTENTLSEISKFKTRNSKQIRNTNIKIIKLKNTTRASGRNLSVKNAKYQIIAMTDGGCIAKPDWLEKITEPFENKNIDIVAGFYKMTGKNPIQKAMSVFLGVMPSKFNNNFLPSTRSMAFRKSAWERVGRFPETDKNSAEDTDFNYKAVKAGLKYARVKNAIVEWGMPSTIYEFRNKIYNYSKWDAKYGIWWHPIQRLRSHNIKSLSILFRYVVGVILLSCALVFNWKFGYLYLFVFIGIYLVWSFNKVYSEFKDTKIAIYGPILQITSDLAVIAGFVSGILNR